MPTYTHFTSGERDEEGNYIIPGENFVVEKQTETPQMKRPKEFDMDYYDEISRKTEIINERWEWTKLRSYAKSVLDFYTRTAITFCKIFGVDKSLYPEFVDFNKNKGYNFTQRNLKDAEGELLKIFDWHKRKLSSRFNKKSGKDTPLSRLQNYGITAWMTGMAIDGHLPIKTLKNFQATFENLDLNDEMDILRAYRGYLIVSNLINEKLKTKNIIAQLPFAGSVYEGVDFGIVYDNICNLAGTFDRQDIQKIGATLSQKIEAIYPSHDLLIDFYRNLEKIKSTITNVKKVSNRYYSHDTRSVDDFWDIDTNENVYEVAKNFQVICEAILETNKNYPQLFLSEVETMLYKLNEAIEYSTPAYNSVYTIE